jgi:Fe-S-cluster containining protein
VAVVRVVRPLVRSFVARFSPRAAAHARAGGHAVVWEKDTRARLVFRAPKPGDEMDLGYWSLLDLDRWRWTRAKRGPFRGLATAPIPEDCLEIVKARIERDSVHPGATRTMRLDCETCAACCRANRVELEPADVRRFERGGRPELARGPYARRDADGKLVLRLLQSRDCRHLRSDKRCGIYELRPGSCRVFPVGSESCLYSREEELGVVDGARP